MGDNWKLDLKNVKDLGLHKIYKFVFFSTSLALHTVDRYGRLHS